MCPVPAHPRFEHPIRLVAGSIPTPSPSWLRLSGGVRPWTWLADPGTADDARSRYLAQYGGPWVSRSMTAATRWEARRARMIRALGCDTCGDGAIKVFTKKVFGSRRQGISIRPDTNTPTRHDRLVPLE